MKPVSTAAAAALLALSFAPLALSGCSRRAAAVSHPATPALRKVRAGDHWTYSVRSGLSRGKFQWTASKHTIDVSVVSAVPDGAGGTATVWDVAVRAKHLETTRRIGPYRERKVATREERQRHQVRQAADGALAWAGYEVVRRSTLPTTFTVPQPFLPPLPSPLAVGQRAEVAGAPLPLGENTGRSGRISVHVEGLEDVETGAGRFIAYRVAVSVAYDDGNSLAWTDWFSGDRLLVKRVISTPRTAAGGAANTAYEEEISLESFTPGR